MIETKLGEIGITHADFQPSNFDWIIDKNLLRDEGVYFGLSENEREPGEKLDAIRQFFMERIRVLEKGIQAQYDTVSKRLQAVSEIGEEIIQRKAAILTLKQSNNNQSHEFWRCLVGFCAYLAMFWFNFWLIRSWLVSSSTENPSLMAIGIYLFGSLSLYSRFSFLYYSNTTVLHNDGEQREAWKVYLEELFIPFVASVYVSFKGSGSHSILETFLFFILIYTLFLFVGKGMLNQLAKIKREFEKFCQNWVRQEHKKEQIKQAQHEIEELRHESEKLKTEVNQLNNQIMDDEKALIMLTEQKETNVALFLSEYELAKSARQTLNRRQITQIISNRR